MYRPGVKNIAIINQYISQIPEMVQPTIVSAPKKKLNTEQNCNRNKIKLKKINNTVAEVLRGDMKYSTPPPSFLSFEYKEYHKRKCIIFGWCGGGGARGGGGGGLPWLPFRFKEDF